jgi:hypothetical protein
MLLLLLRRIQTATNTKQGNSVHSLEQCCCSSTMLLLLLLLLLLLQIQIMSWPRGR